MRPFDRHAGAGLTAAAAIGLCAVLILVQAARGGFGAEAFLLGLLLTSLSVVLAVTLGLYVLRAARRRERLAERLIQSLQSEADDRHRVETTLRASEERWRVVTEGAVDAIVVADRGGRITAFNRAAEALFGHSAAEAIGQPLTLLMPERFKGAHERGLARFIETGEALVIGRTLELAGRRKDGSEFPIEISIAKGETGTDLFFTAVVRDIAERKKVERMKSEFVSTVSHEMRTPMTSIHGSLGLLVSGRLGGLPPQAQTLVDIAYKNSDRLIRLINDILDVERIESGHMPFHVRAFDLGTAVSHAIDATRPYAQELGVEIEADLGPGVHVLGDPDRVIQVVTNLLSNAVKFSPAGSVVTASVTREGGRGRVSVADRGPGIPHEFRAHLFEKFAQADVSASRHRGGTGLGLSIAKAIVDRLGGEITFTTELGQGTTFRVDLPEAPVAGPEIAPNDTADRVLICEDDADVAHLIRMILGQAHIPCDIVPDAAQALRALSERRYAALTLDLILPDRDGVSLIRELRERPETRALPVVVVSVRADTAREELNGGAFGIVDWLAKPIDEARLLSSVRRAVSKGARARLRVLHVEGDADLGGVLATLLSDVAEVRRAGGLVEALRSLEDAEFDLVVLDVALPDGSGLEVLPAVTAPVVIFSAKEVDTDVARRVSAALIKGRTSDEQLREAILAALVRRPAEAAVAGRTP